MARSLRKKKEQADAFALDADAASWSSVVGAEMADAVAAGVRLAPRDGAVSGSPQTAEPERVLRGHIDIANWPRIKGWVWDSEAPDERIRLEFAEGHRRLLTVIASLGRPDLAAAGIGDGLHGFDVDLNDSPIGAGRRELILRCADTGAELPGSPITLDVPATAGVTSTAAGDARPARSAQPEGASASEGDHRAASAPAVAAAVSVPPETAGAPAKLFRCFIDEVSDKGVSGWIAMPEQPSRRCVVVLREGDRLLSRTVASQFRPDLLSAGVGDGCHAFELALPRSLLDGDEHLLDIVEQESGLPLNDEPIRWRSAAGTADKALARALSAAPSDGARIERPLTGVPAEARRPAPGARGPAGARSTMTALRRRGAPFGGTRAGAEPTVGTRILIDVSDLVYYIGHHPNLTGIQRVQSSIVLAIVLNELCPQSDIVFLSFDAKNRRWVAIPTGYLVSLLEDLFLPPQQRLVSFSADEARHGVLPGAIEFDGIGLLDDGNPSVLCLLGAAAGGGEKGLVCRFVTHPRYAHGPGMRSTCARNCCGQAWPTARRRVRRAVGAVVDSASARRRPAPTACVSSRRLHRKAG